ncbi:MAG: glutamate 5-kinase, partial [Pseudomonadota bacterium]|nr:glutamate 5-kinase [Pseudomonadota bacterium]
SGAHTLIAWGREDAVLTRLASGEAIGTLLTAQTAQLTARKQWMADHLQTAGRLVLDAGAVQKVSLEGKSLLPIGVIEVGGEFGRGAVVTCLRADGIAIARGISNYTSSEARRIMRRPSSDILSILGFVEEPELIHRDNLVLL